MVKFLMVIDRAKLKNIFDVHTRINTCFSILTQIFFSYKKIAFFDTKALNLLDFHVKWIIFLLCEKK